MHPQIAAVINKTNLYIKAPGDIAQNSAEKVLNYIDDLSLEKSLRFRTTLSGSFFMALTIGDWEYDMECLKNSYIIFTFTKNGYEKASGCVLFDDFIPQFEKYLLML